ELAHAQQRAFGLQVAAAVEDDVVLERLGIEALRADLVQLAHELIAVAERELDFDFLRHQTRSTSTPGSVAPEMNSNDAPPPVEMWLILSAKPDSSTASTDSPPPTTETASLSATARAMAIVPLANASFSNTPIGPFQKMIRARFSSAAYAATVFGPMSNAF